jgi:hypothetical protein
VDPVGIDGLRNQTEGEKRDVAADVGVEAFLTATAAAAGILG